MRKKSGKVTSPAAKTALVGVLIACIMFMFAGCGQGAASTLEDIASSNADLTKTIKQEIVAPKGMTSDVTFSGDSFDVTFKYDDPIEAKLTYMGEPTATKNEEIHEIVKLADMVDAVHFLHLYGVGKHAEEIRGKMLTSITDPDALDLLEMLLRGEPTTLEEVV